MTKCKQCEKSVKVNGYRVAREGVSAWLCGAPKCTAAYEASGPPTVRKRVVEVVGGLPLVEKSSVSASPRRSRFVPTPDDVARVRKLRATGLAFHKISAEMGWTEDIRGCRAYKIIKSA